MELEKSRSRKLVVAFVLLIFFALISFFPIQKDSKRDFLDQGYVEVNIEDIMILNKTSVVILGVRGERMPIYISSSQARAIAVGSSDAENVRPSTHDLIKSILDRRKIQVLALSIDKLKNGIYYGTLYTKKGGEVEKFDVRPSDGMAVVTRVNKPIFVKKDLLYNETGGQNRTKEIKSRF